MLSKADQLSWDKKPKVKAKKEKKIKISTVKKKAWKAFADYIKLRDALRFNKSSTEGVCVTCGNMYVLGTVQAQAGHFVQGRHFSVLYDERNCHGQCNVCNLFKRGNLVPYGIFMYKTYGVDVVIELYERDKVFTKAIIQDHQYILDKYTKKLAELRSNL